MSGVEAKFGENMVRASIAADLGHFLFAAINEPRLRALLEETMVATGHDLFEAGQTVGRGQAELDQGNAYLRGFFDAVKIFTEDRGEQ